MYVCLPLIQLSVSVDNKKYNGIRVHFTPLTLTELGFVLLSKKICFKLNVKRFKRFN